jgi:asparagine synthase (glutamine-hydrolysing)
MCGIAGIVTLASGGAERRRLAAMQQALRHRGPDDRGIWESPSQRAAFAHVRLSVLDPSPAGRQPMSCASGRFTITFNGAIYNFKELRGELEGKGIGFRTRTDTEVILRAFEVFGDSCVDRLRGMFAFAIWDEQEQTCTLVRDRFGIKPLYFHAYQGGLMFASEVKALVSSGLVRRDLDGQALYEYFRAGSVQEPRTLLRAVRSVEAAQVMTWCGGQISHRKYWDLMFAGPEAPVARPDTAPSALKDSIRHHLVSDVPVGVFLSGGIDSTSLVALATETGSHQLRTFTVSVEGLRDGEADRARRTAALCRTTHHDYRVDAAAVRQLFDAFLAVMDQPSIDGLNTFAVSRFAAAHGMKVMLSGVGADELFGGYPSFSGVPRLTRWRRMLPAAAPLRSAATRLLTASGDPRWRRLADLVAQPPGLTAAYATYRGIFSRAEAAALCQHYAVNAPADDALEPEPADPTVADRVCRLELSRYLKNQLLRDSDVMSMACGVELRTPFLDHVLVEAICRIHASHRLRAGKRLLVESVSSLPDGIAFRRKRCFQFPFDSWANGEWRQTFAGLERVGMVSTVTWYRKWCVMVLQHWLAGVKEGGPAWT